MDRYATGPRSFGAFFWIPGVKTERTAKKRRKKRPKWARYSLTKRVRVADLFLMDRYRQLLEEEPEYSLDSYFSTNYAASEDFRWHMAYSKEQFERHQIGNYFNRLVWRPPLPRVHGSTLAPRDWGEVEKQWQANTREDPAIIVLDDVLRPDVMAAMQMAKKAMKK